MVAITSDILVVFAVILIALAFFATEPIPVDVMAIGVMVPLMLVQPVSEAPASAGMLGAPIVLFGPYPGGALSGFANIVTLTTLATFVPNEGAQRTGTIQLLGTKTSTFTNDSELRQLGATVDVIGPVPGFINNTAAVTILLPMVTDLAERGRTSPSKLLLPLSYASMFGGILTPIGTLTNILVSDVYSYIIGEAPFLTFESIAFGTMVVAVGVAYLMTIGCRLTPG